MRARVAAYRLEQAVPRGVLGRQFRGSLRAPNHPNRVDDPCPQGGPHQPYAGRHFSANARLIDSGFDWIGVAEQMGHESVTTLRRYYEHDAPRLKKRYGSNWLERAFQARSPRKPKPAPPAASTEVDGDSTNL